MNIVLLSGGSGKRLWPLSNAVRSKQFIKFLQADDGCYESMVQRVFRQINSVSDDANIIVTTGNSQKSAVKNQLGEKIDICLEPSRRDTFAAIVLSAAYMRSKLGLSDDDVIIVCPIDPYADTGYFKSICFLEEVVARNDANITLMGVKPTYSSEKYGYILPENNDKEIRKVIKFLEKPCIEQANQYIKQGALWNCGVFAFKLRYIFNIAKQYTDYTTYEDLYAHYDELPKISFDYAVVEKEPNIQCIVYDGMWKDIGTWNTLSEEMSPQTIGNVILTSDCQNVNVINELKIPLLVAGLENVIVAASADGIIVSDKNASSHIKPYVDELSQRVMYKEKAWGDMTILSVDENSLIVKLNMSPDKYLSFHYHNKRDEQWMILDGEAEAVLDDKTISLSQGMTLQIPKGVKHTIKAKTNVTLIETQIGTIDDNDIIRL